MNVDMTYFKNAKESIRNAIHQIRLKIDDLEHELKVEDYSPEGIEMTKQEIYAYQLQLDTLREMRESMEKKESEIWKLTNK